VNGLPVATLVVLAVALVAGVVGAWLARRDYLRGVRELEAYLHGWTDAESGEAARSSAGAQAPGRPAALRARRLRPLYAQLEVRRQAYRTLYDASMLTARRFQTLMDVLRDGVLLYDVDGRLLFVNGPVRELTGAPDALAQDGANEDVLRAVSALLESQSDIPALVQEALQAAGEPTAREVEVRVGGQDRRYMAAPHVIRPRQDPGREGLLVVLKDVAALEAVRKGVHSEVALDHVRLAAELMAHRVRNPLNSIVLVLELLRRSPGARPEPAKNLDVIRGEVSRLEGQVQRFVDMTRRRGRRPEPVNLVSVIESVCELLYAPGRDARVTIRQQLHVPAARVQGDEVELTRALLGPCAEALRAASPGSEVKIKLDSSGGEHLLFLECPSALPSSIPVTVAEELLAANGGTLLIDDPKRPTRVTYRFRASRAETDAT
jgi:signal transduction histidine kinase